MDEQPKPEKPQRRMSCWQCPRYDRTERRCRDGKANPKRQADTMDVAQVLGLQAICHYNPYRDLIALRMYFPQRRILHPILRRRKSKIPMPTSLPPP